MIKQPLVSIIIPTYNRAYLLDDTLDSILTQTYQNWECLVVDDGSTDGTESLVANYIDKDSRFQFYKRPDTHLPGGNGARNYGFELSKGQYIQWFDDDDVMLPEFLNSKIHGFNTDRIDFVFCTGYFTDELLKNKKLIPLNHTNNLYKDYAQIKFLALTPSILFKKEFLLEKSLFDPSLKRGQEMDFFLRLFYTVSIEQFNIIPKGLFLYRQHAATKTKADSNYNPIFKESQTKIYIANLKRSIRINDRDLILMFYRMLLLYFMDGIRHDHKANSKRILKSLVELMGKVSLFLKLELLILGRFILLFNYPSYRVHLRLKYYLD